MHRCVHDSKTPTDAYRGAGRPEATYAIERAMDALAVEIGVDPAELRRRNFIAADKFPYTSGAGLLFDSGNYEPALDRGARDRRLRRRCARNKPSAGRPDRSMHLGIGLSTYVEMCGLAPSRVLASLNYAAGGWETATVQRAADRPRAGRDRQPHRTARATRRAGR